MLTLMKATRLLCVLLMLLGFAAASLAEETGQTGEELFKKNCAACHPDGGNIFNKEKTLFKKDREANKINTVDDIISKMRNPSAFDFHPNKWSNMTVFNNEKLSDSDARKIATYIVETFH